MSAPLVREAPHPEIGTLEGPSHPQVPEEPVLNVDNIQGNILDGFNKDHQVLLFLQIRRVRAFRESLREVIPSISTMREVVTFNRLFKSIRTRLGERARNGNGEARNIEPTNLRATWTSVGFTFLGIQILAEDTGLDIDFEDESFKAGLRNRSAELGDPLARDAEGNPAQWVVVDAPADDDSDELRDRLAHVIVIVAGDDVGDVNDRVEELVGNGANRIGRNSAQDEYDDDRYERDEAAQDSCGLLKGIRVVHTEVGENLPFDEDPLLDLKGHEHFGFLDGVSQPGIRGRLSDDPRDVLTIRQNPNNRDQGKPGQELIWPGEFVFGYPSGEGNPDDEPEIQFEDAGPISTAGPEWANDGSFLVFRRLRQDVASFHRFLNDTAGELRPPDPRVGTPADLVGSKLVGRWRTGAPVLRTPDQSDKPDLGSDDCANNNFEFQESTETLKKAASEDPFDCTDENPADPDEFFPRARRDPAGAVCPFTAHIRKVYPRDEHRLDRSKPTKLGQDDVVRTVETEVQSEDGNIQASRGDPILLNEDDTQTHRILRRGIPFGKPLRHGEEGRLSTPGNPALDDKVPRGLLFLAYQSSIEDQFEFIIRNWVNNPDFKEDKGLDGLAHVDKPKDQGGGHDPIIGQNNVDKDDNGKETRRRDFTVTFFEKDPEKVQTRRVTTMKDWVIPTGGGYFFVPSISALELLSADQASG